MGIWPQRATAVHATQTGQAPGNHATGTEELFDGSIGRHEFLSIATVADVAIAHELAASISDKDARPLTQVQTSYAIDHAIAAEVDVGTKHTLRRWAVELAEPIARVNATDILAKLADRSDSDRVVAVLRKDVAVRQLYLTAVTSRVCLVNRDQAAAFVKNPTAFPLAAIAAGRFAREATNPTDAGGRWCAAKMLQDLSSIGG